jgi:hypothetical protein
LVKKENKQPMDKPKVFSGKTIDNFCISHKLVKTYFQYERMKVPNCHQAKWAQELAGYDFKIVYHPGNLNGKPDALSR